MNGLPEDAPLLRVLQVLRQHDRTFVSFLGTTSGIITRGDLQKAPLRMWFFNLVSLTEMQMLRLIRQRYPGGDWREPLKDERIEAAESLLSDRRRRNVHTDLADCLQFCDKRTIIVNTAGLRELFASSKRAASRYLGEVEDLRNDLAHSQDIITGRWPEIVDVAEYLEETLRRIEGCEGQGRR